MWALVSAARSTEQNEEIMKAKLTLQLKVTHVRPGQLKPFRRWGTTITAGTLMVMKVESGAMTLMVTLVTAPSPGVHQ